MAELMASGTYTVDDVAGTAIHLATACVCVELYSIQLEGRFAIQSTLVWPDVVLVASEVRTITGI